jgi:MtrB/PioB family decaheme-associated outer membrane protein
MTTVTLTRPLARRALYASVLLGLMVPAVALAQARFEIDESDPDVAALTEIRSFLEFGIGYVDDDSFRFGRFTGLHEKGGYGVLNIDWFRRAHWSSPDPTYTRVTAANLGLSSRRASVEHGRQGDYRVHASYRQIPIYRSESGQTIYNGAGTNNLTLPGDWVPAASTAGMSRLLPSLKPVEQRTERRRLGFGLDKLLSDRWAVTSNVRRETKQGIKTIGGTFGNSGGNPRAVILPEPVDYETREVDVALQYADRTKQFEMRYLMSLFDEGHTALTFRNPYSTISGWAPTTGYPTGAGEMALPPDNQFHQVSFAGGYNFAGRMRASGDVAFGRMTQDEDFLAYTIDPVLAASIVQPLPRSSLDGKIDTTVANLRIGDRPTDRLHWNASLRYDDRDNKTPRNEYVYIGGDSMTQNVAANSNRRRFNEPYSYSETRLKFDAGYRFGRRTRLAGAVERRDIERTYSEREEAEETTLSLSLRHAASDWFSGSLRLVRADREGSTYHGNEPFLSGYAPGYTSTVAGGWENPPAFRRFSIADRVRDRLGANITLTPNQHWNIGFDIQRVEDDYRRSELGLRSSESDVYTFDVAFIPSDRLSSYLFYSREQMEIDQNGASIATATREANAIDPARRWNAFHTDDVDTAGAGFKWNLVENRFDLGADYVVARTESLISVTTGSALTSRPLPPDKTRLNSLSLYGKYQMRENLSLQLRLWNERYRSTDFALDGVEANQLANVILLGEESPNYSVNVITASLIYRF